MEAAGVNIDRRKIILGDPIRSLGEFDIEIKLHPDVRAELKLNVVRHGGPVEEEVVVEEETVEAEAVTESVDAADAEAAEA